MYVYEGPAGEGGRRAGFWGGGVDLTQPPVNFFKISCLYLLCTLFVYFTE